MKKVLFLLAIFCALTTNAQNYLISFTGSGAASTVNTVKVDNLMTGITLTLIGNDILHLTGTNGINQVENDQSSALKIFLNPTEGGSKLQIYPLSAGKAIIEVFDITGKQVAHIQRLLDNSLQEFQLSGLNNGLYLISVKGNKYNYSGRLLSSSTANGNVSIEQITNNQAADVKEMISEDKGSLATVDMAYSTGDRLKFTGTSGTYSTVIIDIPSSNKSITFNFIACTDGDNNNYPVVVIGTQTWMAGNLKTTKLNDGTTSISNEIGNTAWAGLTTPAYCWYSNNESTYKATYGALYNWYAVNTKKLCPTGWHVPTVSDFETFGLYVGDVAVVGGKMKETGLTHWMSPNTGATDEIGFTALPGGFRWYNTGGFISIGYYGEYWSSTEYTTNEAGGIQLHYNSKAVDVYGEPNKKFGFSVRCLKE